MKRHNFIPKSYLDEKNKKDRKMYRIAVLLMILLNSVVLKHYYEGLGVLNEAKSHAVFKPIETDLGPQKNSSKDFIKIYKEVTGYVNGSVSIQSLNYQNNLIDVEILSSSSGECIQFVKEIENRRRFSIVKISPIERTENNFKQTIELGVLQ
ncbi:MAG: hypothetical protein Q8930_00690 [Bacillota bacterium]|nr:hypothetical protein [Bacillota bacterium]